MRDAIPYFDGVRFEASRIKSPDVRRSTRMAVVPVAVAAMLSPLNTSMFPVALPDLQREFSTSAGASTWLLTSFALASAVGQVHLPAIWQTGSARGVCSWQA